MVHNLLEFQIGSKIGRIHYYGLILPPEKFQRAVQIFLQMRAAKIQIQKKNTYYHKIQIQIITKYKPGSLQTYLYIKNSSTHSSLKFGFTNFNQAIHPMWNWDAKTLTKMLTPMSMPEILIPKSHFSLLGETKTKAIGYQPY